MKKFLIIFIILFTISPSTFARTWVQISEKDYIDKDSIKYYINDYQVIDRNKKIFWVTHFDKTFYQDLEKYLQKEIAYGLTQYIIDNKKNEITVKSCIAYDKDGQVMSSFTAKDYQLEWLSIAPNSYGEYYSELIKHKKILKKWFKEQQNTNYQF